MIYLLGQIVLCLLLAAIAGWFVGWSLRGFRDQERLEDVRRTLRATEEVKDRELAEAQRQAAGFQARVETLERGAEGQSTSSPAAPPKSDPPPSSRWLGEPPESSREIDGGANGSPPEHDDTGSPNGNTLSAGDALTAELVSWKERAEILEVERRLVDEQRAAAEQELRDRNRVVRETEAELRSLRRGVDERAEELARLERRIVELEPMEAQLARSSRELARARADLEEARSNQSDESSRLTELDERTGELEAAILERDRRINELRQRYQETAARLEVAEADQSALRQRLTEAGPQSRLHEDGADLERCRERLAEAEAAAEEARTTLQRQIERNRKQEVVHQQVVANLREEIRDARAPATPAPAPASPDTDARMHQVIADRDAKILSLLRRLEELEVEVERRPPPHDNLQKIRGIGPKLEELLNSLGIHSFAQIASWSDDDVERMSDKLGVFRDRIRWDDWVESARRHHILSYGKPPEREDWWLPADE